MDKIRKRMYGQNQEKIVWTKWKCQWVENIIKEPKGNSGVENYNNQTEKFTRLNDMMNCSDFLSQKHVWQEEERTIEGTTI